MANLMQNRYLVMPLSQKSPRHGRTFLDEYRVCEDIKDSSRIILLSVLLSEQIFQILPVRCLPDNV